jgi:hypothetical protein
MRPLEPWNTQAGISGVFGFLKIMAFVLWRRYFGVMMVPTKDNLKDFAQNQ